MENSTFRTLIPVFEELRSERVLVRPYRVSDAEALKEAVDESREHIRPGCPSRMNIKRLRQAVIG